MKIKKFIQSHEEFLDIYQLIEINLQLFKKLESKKFNYWILAFVSIECEFCKTHFPHLVKLYENLPIKIILNIWEDFTEEEIDNFIEKYDLLGLPAFIFFDENNTELGRIIKKPLSSSLEQEILNILKKNP